MILITCMAVNSSMPSLANSTPTPESLAGGEGDVRTKGAVLIDPYGAEGLLVDHPAAVLDIAHHCQGNEKSGTLGNVAVGDDAAIGLGIRHVTAGFLELHAVLHRAELSLRVMAITDHRRAGQRRDFIA